jgi:hypothetical protein
VTEAQRIVADFNYGGVAGDEGRVYLPGPMLEDLPAAGIAAGISTTTCGNCATSRATPAE